MRFTVSSTAPELQARVSPAITASRSRRRPAVNECRAGRSSASTTLLHFGRQLLDWSARACDGPRMGTRWADAFPRGFTDTHPATWTPAYEVCLDERAKVTAPTLRVLELPADDYPPTPRSTRLALLWPCPAPAPLADVFPVLENLGLRIAAHAGFDVHPAEGPATRVEEFELVPGDAAKLGAERLKGRVTAAFEAVWTGLAEDDGFNRLVVAAGLSWREVAVLRSTYAYLRQLGTAFTPTYAEQTLRTHSAVAQLLVELFHARFDPTRQGAAEEPAVRDRLEGALAEVANLGEDRLLRSFASVLCATTRTNYYQRDETGAAKPYLVLKVASADLPLVPEPRPAVETFVYSPRMEGLHLRSALVARGGLRWSERPEDYRTEVLGLLQAQRVKNAVIVPHGAKGAFIVKRPAPDTQEAAEAVRTAYATFIRGLLDITDNLVGAETVTARRRGVPRRARLVPGRGRGQGHRHLLRPGQLHRAGVRLLARRRLRLRRVGRVRPQGPGCHGARCLGVSAPPPRRDGARPEQGRGVLRRHRGHVRRRVRQRRCCSRTGSGWSPPSTTGTCSSTPIPTPPRRMRSAGASSRCPGSSWADYRSDLISAGGGVLSRTAKQVPLSPQVRALLGVDAVSLPADQLIRAVLRARVDVLFNGGIGTYVKAVHRVPGRRGRPGQRRGPGRRQPASRAGGRRGRQPRPDPGRTGRVRPGRRPGQRRLRRQLGGGGHLRPGGEPQDPAGRRRPLGTLDDRSGGTRC